jgi:hypothetical protein
LGRNDTDTSAVASARAGTITPVGRVCGAICGWKTKPEGILIDSLNFVLFMPIIIPTHYLNVGNLFISIDGAYLLTLLTNQSIWNTPALGFEWTNLQGLWSLQFPLNAFLIPAYFLPHDVLGITDFASAQFQTFAYSWCAAELFVATLLLGLALKFDRFGRLFAAWMVPFLYLPALSVPLIYPISSIGPNWATAVAQTALLMALFSWQGKLAVPIYSDLTRLFLASISRAWCFPL